MLNQYNREKPFNKDSNPTSAVTKEVKIDNGMSVNPFNIHGILDYKIDVNSYYDGIKHLLR